MSASINKASRTARHLKRYVLVGLMVPAAVFAASWWLTEPLADRVVAPRVSPGAAPVAVSEDVKAAAERATEAAEAERKAPLAWPADRLDGAPAKALLLDVLIEAAQRLNRVETYTATFHKQERIKGKLGPEQTLAMKVRQKPFAVYFKFLSPHEGKEVVYAEGHHDNKVIAHSAGVARFLVPRLAVPPDHPLALADSRHAITEAGLANLVSRLIGFRRMDLDDPEAETVLDRVREGGREWLQSVHTHRSRHPDRPFARVEVLYDPESLFPVDIRNYDWPDSGHRGDLDLAEHYRYEGLVLDAPLTALDFDPGNPEYAFHRY